jgi:putative membrane protein
MTSRPRAFRLSDPDVVTRPSGADDTRRETARILVTEEPADAIEAADGVPVAPRRRRAPLLSMFLAGLGGLLTLAIGIALERLVADLFAASPWLGWLALALAALAALSLVGLLARELRGVVRERRIEHLRGEAASALAMRDGERAKHVAREVAALYADRPRTVLGPGVLEVDGEIMDADDRLALAERTLVAGRDEEAKRAVAAAARQVSLVTALSPRAVVDLAFVLYACAKLLGRISRLYGGRPGTLGFLRLARSALNHLAVTGGVAVGDGLVQSALGLGLAARISAKLGEGVVNGLMTARFGLAAIEVCRPLPFIREEPPRLGDVAGELLARGEGSSTKD